VKKILIIEDDPDVSMVMRDLLKVHGFDAHLFSSGEKAIEAIEDILPDIVVMDLMMPGMNGFDVCRHIRSKSSTRNIPLIAITGYDSVENRGKIFDAGIDDYLPKPFDIKALLKKISDLI